MPRTTPSEHTLLTWRSCDCVCFDVDCTVTLSDGLDLLASELGVKSDQNPEERAQDGSMNLKHALEERMHAMKCTPDDVRRFVDKYPPEVRMTKGIVNLIKVLQKRGVAVYLVSGSFRELVLPIAKYLGIPKENVYANRMEWEWDDASGRPTRLLGFDPLQPTASSGGKIKAISMIREQNPYNTVVMIGDGITDLEAVRSTEGADLFIGYGGVVERHVVAEAADWFVYDHDDLTRALKSSKVAMVGSNAFACAMMPIICHNVSQDEQFDSTVNMWVHDADAKFQGRTILDYINVDRQNPKELPGVYLGDNIMASGNLEEVAKDADVLVFCAPHETMHPITRRLMGKVKRDAIAISLVKGMRVGRDGPQLISQMIRKNLNLDCSVLIGGNIARDLANKELSEAVIASSSKEMGEVFRKLFQTNFYYLDIVQDVAGAEMCGTLKNIVAIAVGILDGMDYGCNAKAVIMRQGLTEMRKLSKVLYPNLRNETFFESCGLGDLIATCLGGRNRATAEAWTRAWKSGNPKTWTALEQEVLGGQRLQGVATSNEVQEVMRLRGWESTYPLFTTVNRIINGLIPPGQILQYSVAKNTTRNEDYDDTTIIPAARAPRSSFAAA